MRLEAEPAGEALEEERWMGGHGWERFKSSVLCGGLRARPSALKGAEE
jgi:hypothetical protein